MVPNINLTNARRKALPRYSEIVSHDTVVVLDAVEVRLICTLGKEMYGGNDGIEKHETTDCCYGIMKAVNLSSVRQ